MTNLNQDRWIDRVDKELIKVLETTQEYKIWQDSLVAIVEYSSVEEFDENVVKELLADHLNASFELQKGLGNARSKIGKKLRDEWLIDNCGE